MFVNMVKDQKPDGVMVAFDRPKPTFRHEANPLYKAQREASPDILRQQMGLVRELLAALGVTVVDLAGWEADDILATVAERAKEQGHDVVIVDNLVRRAADVELGVTSLTPIAELPERLAAWTEVTGRTIGWERLDVARDYDALLAVIRREKADAVVHLAEQRAAPYSMKSPRHKRYTVDNNVSATNNLLCAIVESGRDVHLVHIGTMGVYGYGSGGDTVIPEGYLRIALPGSGDPPIEREILHPSDPGSVYHMTKCLDQQLFYYWAKNDRLRITDLHQGIVWGTNTDETLLDPRLVNRFDYDGDYGTVLNRFLMQAAIGYPLTVHGTGGQTRAFIHVRDTARCIELALDNPPARGDRVKIHNQLTETHRVADLAAMVSAMTGVPVAHLDNPRKEAASNQLRVEARKIGRAHV